MFAEGNIEGIDDWAEELCRNPSLPVAECWTASVNVPSNELAEQLIGLKLVLERMDARLKRLEVERHDF
jgi:hypothetical protein